MPVLLSLVGCNGLLGAKTSAPAEATAPDLSNEGIARVCTASAVDMAHGPVATATLAMSNEGGWCAVRVSQPEHTAFATGLVRVRPEHGRLDIEKSGNQTRIQYFPDAGFVGSDTFTTALRPTKPGAADQMLKVSVTVSRAG